MTISKEDLYSEDIEVQGYIQEMFYCDETSKILIKKNYSFCPQCHTVTQWRFWYDRYMDCLGEHTDGRCLQCGYHEGYC